MTPDIAQTARFLRRDRWQTLPAVFVLVVGLAATVTILAFVDSILFRPLPYNEPSRLAQLDYLQMSGTQSGAILRSDYELIRGAQNDIEDIGLVGGGPPLSYASTAGREDIVIARVTSKAFTLLGVKMLAGRAFLPDDETQGGNVAILTSPTWHRRFGSDLSVVGQRISLGGRSLTIVGILPADFVFPVASTGSAEIVTLRILFGKAGAKEVVSTPIVRLRRGVTLAKAQADIDTLLSTTSSEPNSSRRVILTPLSYSLFSFPPGVLWALLGAALCVLAIVCFNVSTMLIASHDKRINDLLVQVALGCGRLRMLRVLLYESVTLAVSASIVSLPVAYLIAQWLVLHLPARYASFVPPIIPTRLIISGIALPLVVGPLCGLGPALRTLHTLYNTTGTPQTRNTGSAGRRFLIAGQIAVTTVLLTAAGLVLNSLIRLKSVDLGYDPTSSIVATVSMPGDSDQKRSAAIRQQVLEVLRAAPGTKAVGIADVLPMSGELPILPPVVVDGNRLARWEISAGFLPAVGAKFVLGRDFNKNEEFSGARIGIVNRAAALMLEPGGAVLGRIIHADSESPIEVIGIVDNIRNGYRGQPEPAIYVPAQVGRRLQPAIAIRSTEDFTEVARTAQERILSVEQNSVVSRPENLISMLNRGIETTTFPATVLSALAMLALTVSLGGVYGTSARWASARRKDLAIRWVLGAQPSEIVQVVIWQVAVPVATGIAVGLAAALWLTRYISSVLYEVEPTDWLTLLVVVGVLCSAACVGAFLPAYQASRRLDAGLLLR